MVHTWNDATHIAQAWGNENYDLPWSTQRLFLQPTTMRMRYKISCQGQRSICGCLLNKPCPQRVRKRGRQRRVTCWTHKSSSRGTLKNKNKLKLLTICFIKVHQQVQCPRSRKWHLQQRAFFYTIRYQCSLTSSRLSWRLSTSPPWLGEKP